MFQLTCQKARIMHSPNSLLRSRCQKLSVFQTQCAQTISQKWCQLPPAQDKPLHVNSKLVCCDSTASTENKFIVSMVCKLGPHQKTEALTGIVLCQKKFFLRFVQPILLSAWDTAFFTPLSSQHISFCPSLMVGGILMKKANETGKHCKVARLLTFFNMVACAAKNIIELKQVMETNKIGESKECDWSSNTALRLFKTLLQRGHTTLSWHCSRAKASQTKGHKKECSVSGNFTSLRMEEHEVERSKIYIHGFGWVSG